MVKITLALTELGDEGKCFYLSKNNYYELRKNVLRELADGFSCIHDNFKYFKTLNKNKVKIIGAAEWLLDNIYLIEKEYKCVKKCMPLEYFKSLPYGEEYLKYINVNYDDIVTACDNINAKNAKSEINRKSSLNKYSDMENNIPRILIVAKRYINEKRNLEINDLIDYIKYYEDFEENKNNSDYCFTMGELWAFPLMLRIGIILNLAHYTDELVSVQKDVLRGKVYAEKIIDYKNNEKIKEQIDFSKEFSDVNIDLSPLFLREFIRILRENSIEDKDISNYSKLKLNLDMDYNKLSIRANLKEEDLEHNISQYITAIRTVEGINWRYFFENTSVVESILENDPAQVYKNMDFETKDYYRHKLEEIARLIKTSEIKVAMNILDLAKASREKMKKNISVMLDIILLNMEAVCLMDIIMM